MKKILVVDESRAVRETLALILSRDFVVIQRPHLEKESLTRQNDEADLLIFGVSASLGEQPSILLRIASQALLPVLFLIDSRSMAEIQHGHEKMDYLAKPFNPYELKEKVVRLLGRAYSRLESVPSLRSLAVSKAARYIEFPYVPAATSALAKRFAITDLPILIMAEMGSGQERVARTLHSLSGRGGQWIPIYPAELKGEDLSGQIFKKIDRGRDSNRAATIFLGGLESLDGFAQSSLLSFLEEGEEGGRSFRVLSSSCVDLLEKVYRGEFLAPLYYRLATLTLRIPPLRERREDIPSLAVCLAQEFGKGLGIEKVSFSTGATDRLSDYLWFGNLNEMEAVIARTLATHRKPRIEASDLVLGVPEGESLPFLAETEAGARDPKDILQLQTPSQRSETPVASKLGNGNLLYGGVLINELAHELKNPMVTIKTFVQLLGDRFDDAVFRNRFRETVAGDIERMDGLLEALLDFSRFTHPSKEKVFLYEELQRVVDETLPECKKKEVRVQWRRKGETIEIFVDKDQLHYIVRNVLRAVLEQIQLKSEIQVDVKGERSVALTYVREGGRLSPLTHYLGLSPTMEEALPLRILLGKMLLERSGGEIKVNNLEEGRVLIGIELPVS
jgi:DNA-binding NtrC family response regulator